MAERIIDSEGDELEVNADGSINVGGGGVASGSADSGNPVKVGGVHNSTLPTLTNGQRGDVQLDSRGGLQVVVKDAAGTFSADVISLGGDGIGTLNGLMAAAIMHAWNGASLDILRVCNVFKTFAVTAITAGTGATIWTPAAGKRFRVMGMSISSSAAGQLLLSDNLVATIILRSPTLAAGGIWELGADDMGNGVRSATINNVLKIDGPTGNVAGMVWGTEE